MNKKILCGVLTVGLVVALTGCGKENVDISADVDVLFSGYDGYGNATVSKGNWVRDIETKFGSGMSIIELSLLEDNLDDAIEYTLSPSENLRNGDEVVLTIEVDNEVLESYDFKLSGGTKTYTVSGLDEIESFDPFENVAVNFSGMSPSGTASINTSDVDNGISLNYTLDKSSGLKNGDEVTVSIGSHGGSDVEEYCLSKGKIPTATEKKFTVSGLASYAQELSDIPDDMLAKMKNQSQDTLNAHVASSFGKTEKLQSVDFLGYYFLKTKDGFESVTPSNYLYLVYAVKVKIERDDETFDLTYYHFSRYDSIIILEDGTCSVDLGSASTPSNTYRPGFKSYYYYGYGDLDSMFNDCVTSKIDKYTYENTVK